jgi:hypothetical protein
MHRHYRPQVETLPETSDPYLEQVLSQDVLPRFPELKQYEFRICFGPTERDALAQVAWWRLRQRKHVVRRPHLITVSRRQDLSREEYAALVAHEAGHLVNDLKGIRPKTWEEQELAATSQAVARGFLGGFQRLFQRLCPNPCWKEVARTPEGRVVVQVRGRSVAGLYCIGGQGLYHAYCPFASSLGRDKLGWRITMQEIDQAHGACALCKRELTKKSPVCRCSGCSMLFHKSCLESYLKRGQNWCPSCHSPLTTYVSEGAQKD